MAITLTITNLHGQTLASYALGDTLLTIRAENQVQYLLADERGLAPDAMASRAGDDLLVHIEGDAALRIEDYFLGDDSGLANPLLGQNASGQYVAYPISETLSAEHLLAGEIAGASGGISPVAALAAVGGVALAGAAIAGSGKGGNAADIQQEQPQTPFDPNQPPPADNGNITPPPAGGGNPNPPPSGGGNITPPPVNPPPTPAPNNAPAGEVKIAGEAEVGKTLSASHTLKDDDGLGQITYKW
ncbi:MAG: hypothetical protein Q4D61_01895, partial [Cardiobacteriaceae bacterium]|nr:hypothetical protein [Cardiobacteriaceae bacterium]